MASESELADGLGIEDKDPPAPPAWPRVIKLRHPVDFGSEHITEIVLRRGRIGDMKGISLGDTVPVAHLVLIAARLSGQKTNVIELLDVDDAGEVMGIALDFFEKCLAGSAQGIAGRTR